MPYLTDIFYCHLSMMIQHSSLIIGQYVFPLSFALGEIFPSKSRTPDIPEEATIQAFFVSDCSYHI